jgi:hypothetical protein
MTADHRLQGPSVPSERINQEEDASPPNFLPVVQFLLEQFSEGGNAVAADASARSPSQLWRVHCRQTRLNTFL